MADNGTNDAQLYARRVTTGLDWEDLVLDAATRAQIDMIAQWVRHERQLLEEWKLARHLKPGWRAVFHGPPGTGKTLAACLLGKALGRHVYRIDLVPMPALDALFVRAEKENWILLVDGNAVARGRADSDQAANQQIAYLLQRIEDYPGVVILESNLAALLDEAFARRFQSTIRFAIPNAAARLRLWQGAFGGAGFQLAGDIDLQRIARDHEVSGGDIVDVLRFAALRAAVSDTRTVKLDDIAEGLARRAKA